MFYLHLTSGSERGPGLKHLTINNNNSTNLNSGNPTSDLDAVTKGSPDLNDLTDLLSFCGLLPIGYCSAQAIRLAEAA